MAISMEYALVASEILQWLVLAGLIRHARLVERRRELMRRARR
jgi:hypothetical protein